MPRVPFLSGSGMDQWLGQGYYLWTDSPFFAHKWGQTHYRNSYAVNQFEVKVPKESFWDLVGNVEHQFEFLEFKETFHCFLDQLVEQASPQKRPNVIKVVNGLKSQKFRVATFFWVIRRVRKLTYKVVKASDLEAVETTSITFVENGKKECLFLPTRQQIVVYPEAKYMINHLDWVHP